MYCKKCGEQLENSSKFCPHCGAAISGAATGGIATGGAAIGENLTPMEQTNIVENQQAEYQQTENRQKKKKPIYKRWWFWVLALLLLIVIWANACGGDGGETPVMASSGAARPSASTRFVEPSATPTPMPTPTPTPEPEVFGIVVNVSEKANIRSVPNAGGDVLGTASLYEVLAVKSQQDGWVEIDYNGVSGYISTEYFAVDGTPEAELARLEAKKAEYGEFDYKEVSRTPSKFAGNKVKFTGEVDQVIENFDGSASLRVTMRADEYDFIGDTVFVVYTGYDKENRLLEDDIVTVYGVLDGLETYTTVLRSEMTIPRMMADWIELEEPD